MLGKAIRIERLMDRESGRAVIVPMDHGITVGPIKGITNMRDMVDAMAEGGANAVLGHMGVPLHGHRRHGKDVGLILHLSGSTVWSPDPNSKVLVNTVENALRNGADGVSVHVNIGAANETDMLRDLGEVAVKCMEWGMPLLAMMYTRGEKFKSETSVEGVSHAARIAAEVGADMVKVSYTGSKASFAKVVEGCPIPVFIAGGERAKSDRAILKTVRDSLDAGGSGVCMGRNAWQHKYPARMVKAVCALVREDATVAQAMKILAGK
jgi:fructose-bisphosphate aldolase / 2-amino-3,7-dideoxy-D-threo-hept-6-ulosonate synthase